jgi:hypothetical protein
LKVENTVGFVSLRKEGFLGLQLDYPSSYTSFREESRVVERGKASPSHFDGLLAGGNSDVEPPSLKSSRVFFFEVRCSPSRTFDPTQDAVARIVASAKPLT